MPRSLLFVPIVLGASLVACMSLPVMVTAPLSAPVAVDTSDAGAASSDGGMEAAAPSERAMPFRAGDTWRGTYQCGQGVTNLELKIVRVSELDVEVTFDFVHDGSNAAGSFQMSGKYRKQSRKLKLVAGDWVVQPPGYVTVDLDGTIEGDGFSGRVLTPGCTTFKLRRSTT